MTKLLLAKFNYALNCQGNTIYIVLCKMSLPIVLGDWSEGERDTVKQDLTYFVTLFKCLHNQSVQYLPETQNIFGIHDVS